MCVIRSEAQRALKVLQCFIVTTLLSFQKSSLTMGFCVLRIFENGLVALGDLGVEILFDRFVFSVRGHWPTWCKWLLKSANPR
jgi:hypothetical protein